MGKVLTTILLCIFPLLIKNAIAGNPKYGKVLYRVNVGGVQQASKDASSVVWSTDNYDIFDDVGKNVGVMKSYIATSDGMLNIFLSRMKQLPKINGIEIIEIIDVSGLQTLYRVNSGGTAVSSFDTTGLVWAQDDFH